MSEIRWEEETEVREVIADIRDTDCELNWWVIDLFLSTMMLDQMIFRVDVVHGSSSVVKLHHLLRRSQIKSLNDFFPQGYIRLCSRPKQILDCSWGWKWGLGGNAPTSG
jgi:hypothetical protein